MGTPSGVHDLLEITRGNGMTAIWQETLRIRTKSSDARHTSREVAKFLDELTRPLDLVDFQIYLSGAHQNEVMLVMDWGSTAPDPNGSELANSLAFSMKKYGLVDLSLWRRDPKLTASFHGKPRGATNSSKT